jgi:hypothetical protein
MWEPRRLTTLWASTDCYRDSFTFLRKYFQIAKKLWENMQWAKIAQNMMGRAGIAVCEVVSDFVSRKACSALSWVQQPQICRVFVHRIQEVGPRRWQLWYYLRRDTTCITIFSSWCNDFSLVVDIPDCRDRSQFAGVVYSGVWELKAGQRHKVYNWFPDLIKFNNSIWTKFDENVTP